MSAYHNGYFLRAELRELRNYGDKKRIAQLRVPRPASDLLSWRCPASLRRLTAPSTSWQQELPKSRGCQWSATAGGGARRRAIDSRETSERRGFHEVGGAPCN